MPKGVPSAGFRLTRNRINNILNVNPIHSVPVEPVVHETDEQIERKLSERFSILETLTSSVIDGNSRALIVSGPPGLGKSFTVEKMLTEYDPENINHTIIKGFVRATGLYKALYQYQNEGQVIVFDDADSIFFDDNTLSLLKAVCDTTEVRKVSWLSETNMIDDNSGENLPRSFEFKGTIIFISNYDFDDMIDRGHKIAPHLSALISRAHYIDLAMKNRRDYIVRIKQVINQGMLSDMTLEGREAVIEFIETNSNKLRELSLRVAIKIAQLYKSNPNNWEKIARLTCCKN